MNNYDDIINLGRPISKHPKMDIKERAAIFSSFDPLEGFDEKISEFSKNKDKRKELTDEEKEVINNILNTLKKNDNIKITYYNISKYITINSTIKRVDTYYQKIVLIDNKEILFNDIVNIKKIIN